MHEREIVEKKKNLTVNLKIIKKKLISVVKITKPQALTWGFEIPAYYVSEIKPDTLTYEVATVTELKQSVVADSPEPTWQLLPVE